MELRAHGPALSLRGWVRRRHWQGGLSLVELMVAMVVALLLTAGVIQIYASSKQSYSVQEAIARMQENGRFAMDLITQDLRRAGYWGGNADTNTISGTPFGPVAPAAACAKGNSTWGRMIGWRVHGLNDTAAAFDCIENWLRGDVVSVRYADAELADALEDDRLYVRSNLFAGRIITGVTADRADNQVDALGADAPLDRELRAYAYYVGASAGATCAATGAQVPALWRVGLDDEGGPQAVEMASGVEQLQFQYLEGIQYRDANAVGDWSAVSAVRVWLLLRAACPDATPDENVYEMGDLEYEPADNFRRQLYVSTVMLRNAR